MPYVSASVEIEGPQLISVCREFSAKGKRRGINNRIFAEPGRERWLWIVDDTGYRDQNLTVIAHGGGEVCLSFTVLKSRGTLQDSGYRKQNLRIRTDSLTALFLDSIQKGRRSEQRQRSGWVCSSDLEPSSDNYLGDASGYKNQRLKIPFPNLPPN